MRVFVYGTVMPGGKYYDYIFSDNLPSFLEAKVRGKLYDLNVGYPGLLLGGENWVFGFLLSFEDENILKKLDMFEGFDETNSQATNEYDRTITSVFDLEEDFLGQAWVYSMNENQLSRFNYSVLESGVWKK
tara:strand:- start:503 stop:895 length:393 start_codon:yes stop_codon:yes gene_type:complete